MARWLGVVVGTIAALALVTTVAAEDGSQGWLHPIVGNGTGRVIVSPTAQEHGEFYAQGEIEVDGVPANSTMYVTRALFSDATCSTITRPWAPVAPGSFTTSNGGSGTMHFVRDTSNVSGTTFHTEFRVSGNGTTLQSDCLGVYVK